MNYNVWGVRELITELEERNGILREQENALWNAISEQDWKQVQEVRDAMFEKMQTI
jgi:hypothetical protein